MAQGTSAHMLSQWPFTLPFLDQSTLFVPFQENHKDKIPFQRAFINLQRAKSWRL